LPVARAGLEDGGDRTATPWPARGGTDVSLGTILLIVLILLLIGALPSWPYSRGWGYYPSGGLGLLLLIVLILLVMGRL